MCNADDSHEGLLADAILVLWVFVGFSFGEKLFAPWNSTGLYGLYLFVHCYSELY